MKKNTIYIWALSIIIIVLPLYFGFPVNINGEFTIYDHGNVKEVTKQYYYFAKTFQVLSIIGIIFFVIGFINVQKQLGFRPSLIITRIERGFFSKLINKIKQDYLLILIFTIDLVVIIIGLVN